jgi:glutaminyl-tRNA synthetase
VRAEKEHGEVVRVICRHDPATRGGVAAEGQKVDGTLHWVSAGQAKDVEVRLYDRLFSTENPGSDEGRDWLTELNPASLTVLTAKAEPSLAAASAGDRFQFERVGFFSADPDSVPGAPVFNRTVALKDSWAKKAVTKGTLGVPKVTVAAVPSAKRAEASGPPGQAAGLPAPLSLAASALVALHGLSADEARVLSSDASLRALFDAAIASPGGKEVAKAVASVIANDLLGELRSRKLAAVPFDGSALVALVELGQEGTISTRQAKEVLAEMIASGKPARRVVEEKGMKQIASSDALVPVVDQVLSANADTVARYKGGNANVFGALVGLVMKQTKGQGNPKLIAELLKAKLG